MADELRPEYELKELGPGVRGKYHERVVAGTNVVVLDPDVAKVFPTPEAVNRALRMLVEVAEAAKDDPPRGRSRTP